jgi:hypothetical protein
LLRSAKVVARHRCLTGVVANLGWPFRFPCEFSTAFLKLLGFAQVVARDHYLIGIFVKTQDDA